MRPATMIESKPCSPRYATARNPQARTLGLEAGAIASLIGRPLIPWQQQVADVALELREDGRLAHRFVVLIVPRRAGKSLLMLCSALAVTHVVRGARAAYLSHRRETAAALWRDEWFPMLEETLVPRYLSLRTANGSEAIEWRGGRHSGIRLLPPKGDAIRSASSALALIDEAREIGLEQGREIEAGAFPTQATGWGGQTWIVSNAGDAGSDWLRGWRDRGRAALEAGDPSCVLIEYAAPDGADPDDPVTWRAAHPGLGYHVLEDVIAADHAVMTPDAFAAEYLGLWPETLRDQPLVDGWLRSTDDRVTLRDPVTLALELDLARETIVIVAAGAATGGTGAALEIVEHGVHGPWVPARLLEVCERWSPAALVFDRGSPAAALAPELADLPVNLVALGAHEVAAAVGAFHDQVLAGAVRHRDDVRALAGILAARRRPLAGGWTFDRREPAVGPALAAAFALWGHRAGDRRAPNLA